ncbi:hypothetical protein BCR34DRAFT_562645 [Clohesyomyces aquaticus]|uniref:Zn(2)-C6 fungal-type domain-containing protein n=1 Tax=Clohesyomyces aquaticus TaxID=1231657 RepID=A0A1Y1ZS58_9PLEO|nr:hypothetical protein BCR34DRAFT_562645 [Clohesyomyces aquaticus]
MGYHGLVSKGCQRCRQRKIKCDQRRPGCMRCEKSKKECPGFRNLADVVFRDESSRLIQKTLARDSEGQLEQSVPIAILTTTPVYPKNLDPHMWPTGISPGLSQPINEIGAHFFFANYTCDEPPLSKEYITWLMQMYTEGNNNYALRASVEAAGMAGLSNIFDAPDIASKSKEHYGRALAATNRALSNPVEASTDMTLAAVTFLGLFEFVTIENWDHYGSWAAHIEGAAALLQLRGEEQFSYERGGQLYMQLRSQILFACMQQNVTPPPSLLRASREYQNSALAERRNKTLPRPIGDLYFQLIELRAAMKKGSLTDRIVIRETAISLDEELVVWKGTIPEMWKYTTIDAVGFPPGACFRGKRHLYNRLWTARVWNNWRTVRILLNRIIIDTTPFDTPIGMEEGSPMALIRENSTEICISSPDLIGSPRSATLMWPLLVVSQEPLNPPEERFWAVEQLRRIGASMGIRQAGILADVVAKSMIEFPFTPV